MLSLTYTTRVTTALLRPLKSKSLNVKLMAIGLLSPCLISILLMRNGSIGGIAKPECPFGWFCTMSVITLGRHSVSAALHCGKSLAVNLMKKWIIIIVFNLNSKKCLETMMMMMMMTIGLEWVLIAIDANKMKLTDNMQINSLIDFQAKAQIIIILSNAWQTSTKDIWNKGDERNTRIETNTKQKPIQRIRIENEYNSSDNII